MSISAIKSWCGKAVDRGRFHGYPALVALGPGGLAGDSGGRESSGFRSSSAGIAPGRFRTSPISLLRGAAALAERFEADKRYVRGARTTGSDQSSRSRGVAVAGQHSGSSGSSRGGGQGQLMAGTHRLRMSGGRRFDSTGRSTAMRLISRGPAADPNRSALDANSTPGNRRSTPKANGLPLDI